MDPNRKAELVGFIRENTGTVPWPKVREILSERGYTAEEMAAGLDEVFPGQKGRRSGRVRAGLIGAAVGVAVWLVLALLYRG